MSIVTLTYHHPDPTPADVQTFNFEHTMAHRAYFVAMAPLDRFSVLPYLFDPFPYPQERASQNWNLNHQQAHNDAWNVLPAYFEEPPPHAGLAIGQILKETDFDNPDQVTWWTFQNHMEHYVANQATFTPATVPPDWTWPFW